MTHLPKDVLGSTFVTTSGMKLLIERELGDGLIHVISLPSGAVHRVENPETGELQLTDHEWFERSIADGELRRIADRNGPLPPEREQARVFDRETILALDPFAEARLKLMLGLIERGIKAADPRLGGEAKKIWKDLEQTFGACPPTSTIRSWYGRITSEDVGTVRNFVCGRA